MINIIFLNKTYSLSFTPEDHRLYTAAHIKASIDPEWDPPITCQGLQYVCL